LRGFFKPLAKEPRVKNRVLAAGLMALASLPVHAQTTAQGDEVVVSASRVPTRAEQVGGAVTVITGEEMERRQLRTVVDALQTVPGLSAPQLGGVGSQTSVFLRGGNSNQTLVLVDGVEASDPSASNGAFDFAHLTASEIERIEVLRGPAAGAWGSNAIGGVVNIITRSGKGKPAAYAEVEGGSHKTFNQRAGASAAGERWDVATGIAHLKTDGQSVTSKGFAVRGFERDPDGYENWTASFKGGVLPTDNTRLSLVLRHTESEADLDVTREDPDSHNRQRSTFARGEATGRFLEDVWTTTAGFSYARHDRQLRNAPDLVERVVNNDAANATLQLTDDNGTRMKADWRNDFRFVPWNLASVGIERRRDEMEEATFSRFDSGFGPFVINGHTIAAQDTNTVYVQDKVDLSDRFFVTGDVRGDYVDGFGSEYTWRVSPVYVLRETGTRLKGSAGTGFRAPALYELYGFTSDNFGGNFRGNPALGPEHSRGIDAGFEQAMLDNRVSFGSTLFHSEVKGLIVCDTTSCRNVARARINGVESFAAVKATDTLGLRLDHTWMLTENVATSTDLQRRPQNKTSITATWTPVPKASLSATAMWLSDFADTDFVSGRLRYTEGYMVVNAAAGYDVTDGLRLFGRVDNLFNRDYQIADGFAGRGLTAIAGVRAGF
jgi:vitamin B12 transporter